MKRREFLKRFAVLTATIPFIPKLKEELEPLRSNEIAVEGSIDVASQCCVSPFSSRSSLSSSSSSSAEVFNGRNKQDRRFTS